MKAKVILLIIGLLSFYQFVQSQVTIGSGEAPLKGAILDLKEDDNTEKNSSKGLGLPRVELSSPTILTVDDNSNRNKYKGLTVYNLSTVNGLAKGTYTWDGTKWMQVVIVEKYGTNGQMLTSKGNGSFDWSTVTIPDYSFSRPTQIATFDSNKATDKTYWYSELIERAGTISGTTRPRAGLFDRDFVYTEKLIVKSDAAKHKYMLLGLTAYNGKEILNDYTVANGYWELVIVDVYIDGAIKKTYQRVFSTNAGGSTQIYIDVFSVIPLGNLTPGEHTLQIKISIGDNIFTRNSPNNLPKGNFDTNHREFLKLGLRDLNFILYEDN